jgi:intracellular septation protein
MALPAGKIQPKSSIGTIRLFGDLSTMHGQSAPPQLPLNHRQQVRSSLRALFLGGVLPVIAFALVEEWYGTIGGLIAGVVFGVSELTYEYVRFRKVQGVTIAGSALVIILGGLSLIEGNAVLFKLQPAFLLFAFAGFLLVSSAMKRPFLVEMSQKQMTARGQKIPEEARLRMGKMNTRIGVCLLAIGFLSIHAAYYWSTPAWAFLKGIGAPAILIIYMCVEILVLRKTARARQKQHQPPKK